MNLLDILLAIPIFYLIFKGWKRGLVREVSTLSGLLVGIWATVHFSSRVAVLLGLRSEHAVLVAFVVTFVGVLLLTHLLGHCMEGLMKAVKLSLINRLAGALLGMVKALCILAVLLSTLTMLDNNELVLKTGVKEHSFLYQPVYDVGSQMTSSLKHFIEAHQNEWKQAVGHLEMEVAK